jgi:hypothetical protein
MLSDGVAGAALGHIDLVEVLLLATGATVMDEVASSAAIVTHDIRVVQWRAWLLLPVQASLTGQLWCSLLLTLLTVLSPILDLSVQ